MSSCPVNVNQDLARFFEKFTFCHETNPTSCSDNELVNSLCYLVFEANGPVNRKPKSSRSWPKTKKLLTYFVLLLVVLGLAARPIARGALFYQSYWGGAVFVPVVLFVAAVILVIAVMDWNRK